MKITEKKLAIAMAIVTIIQMFFYLRASGVYLIINILLIVLQGIMVYTMYRERNDTFTMVMVIIYAILQFNIPVAVLIVLALCIRYNKGTNIALKIWFVPAIICFTFNVNSIMDAFRYGSGNVILTVVFSVLTGTALYLILGYWLIRSLGIVSVKSRKDQAEKEREIAYYEQLYRDGVLTKEEFAAKNRAWNRKEK